MVDLSKCYSKLLKLKVWKDLILRHSKGNEYGFNSRHQLFLMLENKGFLEPRYPKSNQNLTFAGELTKTSVKPNNYRALP